MRVLAISSAYGGAQAAMVLGGRTLGQGHIAEEHGLAAALPAMLCTLLAQAGGNPDLVAVVVGPGSFTGLRAGLSVGCGIAMGYGVPSIGVSVAEALAHEAAPLLQGRCLLTAIAARRGRVFIDREGAAHGFATDALPAAPGRVAVCGNAATLVAATLAARGCDVMLTALRAPSPEHVAAVAIQRARGALPPRAALPLYVDAPEAKRPVGLRMPPLQAVSA